MKEERIGFIFRNLIIQLENININVLFHSFIAVMIKMQNKANAF